MTAQRIAIALLVALSLAGCASSRSADVYSRQQARQEMYVRMGYVESIREVTMEGARSGAGTVAGAAIGGAAGSTLGRGSGHVLGAVVGAVIGGMAGSAIEENATKKNALEILVRLDAGQLIAVVQEKGEVFYPGDRVRVLTGNNSTRVTR